MGDLEVKVTRRYQVTIPEEVRSRLGIKVGDRLLVREEEGRVVYEPQMRVADPVEYLWSLSERARNVDAVRLVEDSWMKTQPREIREALKAARETRGR